MVSITDYGLHGLAYLNKFGYLAELSYYDNGYTYDQYGGIVGRLKAKALRPFSRRIRMASDLIDEFNQAGGSYEGKLYPRPDQIPAGSGRAG